ncbi:gcn5-like n-acetyltransferase [Fusarium albosuccineum]|uniref:Gcn5-like n-acetyltransferase n=1 Tax=Fusarium albosuccineum TaxID=1237068 RepID=A0A8H4PDH4_9HYPO|nr:gcn5-like n-acetyltransferase [Fusarium albosuccineum]
MAASFVIRPATIAALDHELLVDFRHSQLSWLSTVGSGDQWGTKSTRNDPVPLERGRSWVERSEKDVEWDGDWCRAFVAEASNGVPVAGLVLDSKAPAYVNSVLPEQDESDPFVYLAYLISNRNASAEERKGVGAALIAFAKDQVRSAGVSRICLDCFRGNDRKLVRYYESQGFKALQDFTAGEKKWQGCVLEMRL